MISVTLPAGFQQERSYVFHVLLHELLGLEYRTEIREHTESYHIDIDGREIRIRDAFFSQFKDRETYLLPESIPSSSMVARHPELNDIVCIFGEDTFATKEDTIDCGVDIIAGAFFMLTRWEETVSPVRDAHGRFPAQASLAFKAGFLDRPVVDEYAALLKQWLLQSGVPRDAFHKHQYKLSLQSDVDTAQYWTSPFSIFRKIGFRLFKQKSLAKALQEFGGYVRYLRKGTDSYNTYDDIMDLAEQCHQKACFFFPVAGEHQNDNTQVLGDKHVFNIFAHIVMRGHHTGVHYSYLSADDANMMEEETALYRSKEPEQPLWGRQHFLRCTVPDTWEAWEQSGVREDFTMGYPEAPGFRCGICHPFPLFDVLNRRILNVREHPLIAMDITFHRYLKLTPKEAIDKCKALMETVRRYDGEFVLLWHNSSFDQEWRGWENVLEEVMLEK